MATRRKAAEESFTGMTLEQWQSNANNVAWARREPVFKHISYIVLNELPKVVENTVGCSGERAFGRVEGFKMALNTLRALTVKPTKEEVIPELEFSQPSERNSLETPEVHD